MRSLINSPDEDGFADEVKYLHKIEQRRRLWRMYVAVALASILGLTLYHII